MEDRTVLTRWEGGMRAVVEAGGFEIVVDEPETSGGTNTGPQPTDLLLASVASCITLSMAFVARTPRGRAGRAAGAGGGDVRRSEVRPHLGHHHLDDRRRGGGGAHPPGRADLLRQQHPAPPPGAAGVPRLAGCRAPMTPERQRDDAGRAPGRRSRRPSAAEADGGEEPQRTGQPGHHDGREQHGTRERERPAGAAAGCARGAPWRRTPRRRHSPRGSAAACVRRTVRERTRSRTGSTPPPAATGRTPRSRWPDAPSPATPGRRGPPGSRP